MDLKPWELHPALTEERLCKLAKVIKSVRDRTLVLYDPSNGDGVWSLGCRIYERTINTIEQESNDISWLGVIRAGLYFIVLIEGVPIRFYKGEVENPSMRSLRRLYPEIEAQQCEFSFAESEWFWRVVVETDDSGGIIRIVMVQYRENGNFRNLWEVPTGQPITVVSTMDDTLREGKVLKKPVVGPKRDKTLEVAGDGTEQ